MKLNKNESAYDLATKHVDAVLTGQALDLFSTLILIHGLEGAKEVWARFPAVFEKNIKKTN